jgi:hypothetical protein
LVAAVQAVLEQREAVTVATASLVRSQAQVAVAEQPKIQT